MAHFVLARVGVLVQQRLGRHEETRRADAALQAGVLEELLQQEGHEDEDAGKGGGKDAGGELPLVQGLIGRAVEGKEEHEGEDEQGRGVEGPLDEGGWRRLVFVYAHLVFLTEIGG